VCYSFLKAIFRDQRTDLVYSSYRKETKSDYIVFLRLFSSAVSSGEVIQRRPHSEYDCK
jgi:hypothetical protein